MNDRNGSVSDDPLVEQMRVQMLAFQPGDIIVFSYPEAVTPEYMARFREAWKLACPEVGVRAVVLDRGGQVDSILRPDPE